MGGVWIFLKFMNRDANNFWGHGMRCFRFRPMSMILRVKDSARLDQNHRECNGPMTFLKTTIYQVSTSNQMHGIMVPVRKFLILQQINIEKNGLHRLED